MTLSPKDGLTDQLRRWNVITPNDTIIIRPDQLGGSYVVPRPFSTIRDDAEPTRRELLAEQLGVPVESIVDVGLRDYAGRSTDVLQGFIEGAGFSVLGTGEALIEIAKSPRQLGRLRSGKAHS